jgi:hypothetical protein
MPTERERQYYRDGYSDGFRDGSSDPYGKRKGVYRSVDESNPFVFPTRSKPKRKLSAWNKFVKANSRKKEFRYRDGKLNLKKMGVAFRRKKRR